MNFTTNETSAKLFQNALHENKEMFIDVFAIRLDKTYAGKRKKPKFYSVQYIKHVTSTSSVKFKKFPFPKSERKTRKS